jgi:MoaA/NifB/PqqE/SkfB family radical SAM enzyme
VFPSSTMTGTAGCSWTRWAKPVKKPTELSKKLRFAKSFLRNRLVHVNLQILYSCNYRCAICDFWKPSWRHKPALSAAQAEVISDKLNLLGPQLISIGGGEPMLHAELSSIVRALATHHFPVMITNGSLVTSELARDLFAAGMVEISVSVDYASPGKHDAQRGVVGAHARAIEALQILQANRTNPEQRVNMISVILEDNLLEVEPLLEICRQMGITYLVTLYSHSRGSKAERPASANVGEYLGEIKQRHRHFVALRGYLERFTEAVAQNGIGPCYAGRNLCNIDSQGNVGLCIDRLEDPVGNILTDDIFVIERRLVERFQRNQCRDCWTSCRGSIEAVRHGRGKLANLLDYYQMTRPVALNNAF